MNRLGWAFVGVVLVALTLLGLSLSFQSPDAPAPPREPVPPVARVEWQVPVVGVTASQLVDSWHDAREGGARGHEAIDIAAPGGTPVVAAQAGTVEKLFESERGGTTLYVRSPDSRIVTYYAHLSAYAPGIIEGRVVKQGESIAYVGDTGDAGPGNTHLHFGISVMQPGERWWQGTPVNPYPLLVGVASVR